MKSLIFGFLFGYFLLNEFGGSFYGHHETRSEGSEARHEEAVEGDSAAEDALIEFGLSDDGPGCGGLGAEDGTAIEIHYEDLLHHARPRGISANDFERDFPDGARTSIRRAKAGAS